MSDDNRDQIHDEGHASKYFHQIINMADDELDPYQYRLYGHYKRVCGETGACWEGTRKTAAKCKMSVGKVASTRKELESLGYIRIESRGNEDTLLITIVDRWAENILLYAKCSPREHPPVHDVNTPVHQVNERITPEVEQDSAPDGAAADEDDPATPPATSKKRKPNPMYDAVFDVWGYSDSMNGAMAKMLTGVATRPQWKDGNVSPPMTPEDVRAWAGWYRRTALDDNPDLNMLEERMKIQSSVNAWRAAGCPTGVGLPSDVEYANGEVPDYWTPEYGQRVQAEAAQYDTGGY